MARKGGNLSPLAEEAAEWGREGPPYAEPWADVCPTGVPGAPTRAVIDSGPSSSLGRWLGRSFDDASLLYSLVVLPLWISL